MSQILDLDGNELQFLPPCMSAMHIQTLSLKKVVYSCVHFVRLLLMQHCALVTRQNKLGARSKRANWLTKFTSALTPGTPDIFLGLPNSELVHSLKFQISTSKTS